MEKFRVAAALCGAVYRRPRPVDHARDFRGRSKRRPGHARVKSLFSEDVNSYRALISDRPPAVFFVVLTRQVISGPVMYSVIHLLGFRFGQILTLASSVAIGPSPSLRILIMSMYMLVPTLTYFVSSWLRKLVCRRR